MLVYQLTKNAKAYYMYEFAESGNKLAGVASLCSRGLPLFSPLSIAIQF
jgi:hypothetical protein